MFSISVVVKRYAGTWVFAVEDQLLVDVVHDEVDAALFAELDEFGDQRFWIQRSRWVVRAVDDDGLGVGGDGILDLRETRDESAVFGRHDHRDAIDHLDDLWIAHPEGCEDDHFILRVEKREQEVVEGLLGACGDHDVVGCDDAIVILLGIPDDCLPE